MPRMRAIDSTKRSRASPSSMECTSRDARLPRSPVSTGTSASSPWSNSYRLHFAAVGCRCAIRFLVVASHVGQGTLSLAQPAAQVGRTKRVFKIHAGSEPDHGPFGKISLQRPAQARLVSDACRPSRRWGALIAIATEVEARRAILPHALHL